MWKRVEVFLMAYLIKIKRSPYHYLRYRDLDSGKWKEKNTKLRTDCPKDSAKALKLAAKKTQEETLVVPIKGEGFSGWVDDFIASHYSNIKTRRRCVYFWRTLHVFLHEHGLIHPRDIHYRHAEEYLRWRKSPIGGDACHNTARMELKFLSFLIDEAIRREFCDRNVVAVHRVEIAPSKEKRELTDEDIQAARAAFAEEKGDRAWMAVAFELLIHLGCRFNEARIPLGRINFKAMTIQVEDSKRKETDPRKWFTTPLSKQLADFLKTIPKHDGFTLPPLDKNQRNRDFNRILRGATGGKRNGVTSHSCRVSFISRSHRGGLSESEAMRLVNHSTRMVHRVYSKLNVEDARSALKKVPLPPPMPPKKP
jgi:hypothetical protein